MEKKTVTDLDTLKLLNTKIKQINERISNVKKLISRTEEIDLRNKKYIVLTSKLSALYNYKSKLEKFKNEYYKKFHWLYQKQVEINSSVKLISGNIVKVVKIVGKSNSDFAKGIISNTSMTAQELLGKHIGDTIFLISNGKFLNFYIAEIR